MGLLNVFFSVFPTVIQKAAEATLFSRNHDFIGLNQMRNYRRNVFISHPMMIRNVNITFMTTEKMRAALYRKPIWDCCYFYCVTSEISQTSLKSQHIQSLFACQTNQTFDTVTKIKFNEPVCLYFVIQSHTRNYS